MSQPTIRDLLTEKEIEEIKTRVVKELVNGYFLTTRTETDEEGTYEFRDLNFKIKSEIQDTVREMLHEEVSTIARETIAPRIAVMATKMTDRFVKQTTEIVDKINWYWSIK